MRRRLLDSEGAEMEKEWKLIADINFSEDTHSYTFENLDCTELYVEVQGLRNISATESGMRILINDSDLVELSSQKNNDQYSQDRYQQTYLRYNGLFWFSVKTNVCNSNVITYHTMYQSLLAPYIFTKADEPCKKITIKAASSTYDLNAGNVKIYGR
nr:MAG TPA: hypothetical protein [Caudoviricetes sp.]